jgi:hypothetical protein
MEKLKAPRAYCISCGAAYRAGGGICHRTIGGHHNCRGIVRLAANPKYWKACSWCNASGGFATQTCGHCKGDGWVLAGSLDAVHGGTTFHPRLAY